MNRRRFLFVLLALTLAFAALWRFGRPLWVPIYYRAVGKRTVQDVIREIGPGSRGRLEPRFRAAGVAYPPTSIALLAFKDVKRLELWARDGSEWRHVRDYPIRGASGDLGPKLREGDGQVPEGAYQIKGLNPNSAFHLSMELNYPNAWDLEHARAEGRSHPGTDIFIHGASASIGCLAMGDLAIEELFVLVVDVGPENVEVYIAPTDLRTEPPPSIRSGPAWLPELYAGLAEALRKFRRT